MRSAIQTGFLVAMLGLLGLVLSSCSDCSGQLSLEPTSASAADSAVVPEGSLLCSGDADQDGISNRDEGACCLEQEIFNCPGTDSGASGLSTYGLQKGIDTDNDGTPDFQDLDSDNDGVSDVAESGGTNVDLDGDGKCDTVCTAVIIVRDTDQNGTPDYLDLDSDDNGISDLQEKGALCTSLDGRTCEGPTIAFVPITLEDLGLDNGISEAPPVSPSPAVEIRGGGTGTGVSPLPNPNLLAIILSSGTLTPTFSEDVTSYTASVGSSNITVTPHKKHSGSTITVNGTAVNSGNPSGNITLSYGTDATITITVTAIDGTTRTYTITATLRGYSSQEAYVKASNTGGGGFPETGDLFGWSVAISGDTLAVGAYSEGSNATGINGNESDNSASGSGAVYVFVRSGTTWTQQAYLKASNTGASDHFGVSVAISGDTIVVGSYLEYSSATGINGDQTSNGTGDSGAAYVFVRSGTTWSQQAYIKASNTGAGDQFGFSVAISGDTIAVSAYLEDSSATGVGGNQSDNSVADSGAAYVFVRSGTTWSQQAYLKASNTGASDRFGSSIAISGDTIVIGAYLEGSSATGVNGNQSDNSASNSGAAYVFVRNGTTWSQQAYLKASNTGSSDAFGASVAISGDTIAIGAYQEDSNATGVGGNQSDNSASDSGAAYVFVRNGTTWSQQAYLKASNTGASDIFGYSVAISGDTLVIGAYQEDSNATGVGGNQSDNSADDSGAAYVFARSGTTWSQQAYLKTSNTDSFDIFGYFLAISGDTIVIGAYQEDSNATGVGGNQSNNSADNSGAAYVFVR